MNPYQLLNLSPEATAQEIVQASVLALRENRYSARDIAEARKVLMNPASRRFFDFIYSIDFEPLLREIGKSNAALEQADISEKQVDHAG
jgi:curved DNA-binding protein CbpA